ncbi:MAG: alternative ribosome rescue aminoacyl-tRNA hydrolase ArfB [Candidatus Dependentiae bacterium]|nr:alternative ribosome rescue aminoacyl-tRNA hydrolase ArfB [Candidatus Dependentiae bacterium]
MKLDVPVKNGITIPEYELEITTSRSGGAGGQHVNKTDTRITVRWNVKNTTILTPEQKERVLTNLASRLTADGDLIIHSSESRSQTQNKEAALARLAQEIRKALYVPKKRMKTKVSKAKKEARLHEKTHRGSVKKLRSKKIYED